VTIEPLQADGLVQQMRIAQPSRYDLAHELVASIYHCNKYGTWLPHSSTKCDSFTTIVDHRTRTLESSANPSNSADLWVSGARIIASNAPVFASDQRSRLMSATAAKVSALMISALTPFLCILLAYSVGWLICGVHHSKTLHTMSLARMFVGSIMTVIVPFQASTGI
jgi:hypothetical protein